MFTRGGGGNKLLRFDWFNFLFTLLLIFGVLLFFKKRGPGGQGHLKKVLSFFRFSFFKEFCFDSILGVFFFSNVEEHSITSFLCLGPELEKIFPI